MNNRIKTIRKHFRMTQLEFSNHLKITLNLYKRVENGKEAAPPDMINKLCHIFKINEGWLQTGLGLMLCDTHCTQSKEISPLRAHLLKAILTIDEQILEDSIISILSFILSTNSFKNIEDIHNKVLVNLYRQELEFEKKVIM